MRERVETHRPDLLEAVLEALGADPFEHLDEGTGYLQPAIFCAGLASLRGAPDLRPDFYAGHSLGELTALVAAGALAEEDGLTLVVTRGRLMQRVADEEPEAGMLAVGSSREVAEELAAPLGLAVANDNSPSQIVVSGDGEAIRRARAAAAERGLRTFRLPIRGAFHTPALARVVPEYRAALDAVEVRPPRRPVLSCVTAADFDDVRRRLAESLISGVRWREVVMALRSRGVRRFVEAAPGRVLTKLVRRTCADVEADALDQPERVLA
jgi:[acyl-carrier-protein] S-malonyltransferase